MIQNDHSFSRKRSQASLYKKLSLNIVVLLSMFGSFLFVYSPATSFLNLFAFSLTPVFLLKLSRSAKTLSGILFFFSLFFFLLLTIIVWISEPSLNSTREFRNVIAAIFFSALALVCLKVSPIFSFSLARLSFYLLSAVALLQVSNLFLGIGIPVKIDETFVMYGQTGLELAFPSVFGNPNDFSSFVLCYLLVVLVVKRTGVSSDRTLFIDLVLIATMLMLSGSKSAIAISLIGFFMFSKLSSLVIILSAISGWTWISVSGLGREDVGSDLYAINRIMLDLDLMLSGSVGNSLSVRAGSHLIFLTTPIDFFFGSFSYDPVCPQFLQFGGDYLLIADNPHSFIIGAFCAFGVFAVPFFAALFLSVSSALLRFGSSSFFDLYMIVVFLVATSISSWFLSNSQCVFLLVLAFSIWLKFKVRRGLE